MFKGLRKSLKKALKTFKKADKYFKTYGITEKDYANLYAAQDGKCKVCTNPPKRLALAVDHDHKTGKVRGLLCFRCNRYLLGMLERYKNSHTVLRNLNLYCHQYTLRGEQFNVDEK